MRFFPARSKRLMTAILWLPKRREPMFRSLDSNQPLFYQTYSLVAIWIHFVKVAKQQRLLRTREVPTFDESRIAASACYRRAVPLPAIRSLWRPRHGVQTAVRRTRYQRRHPPFLSLRLGGTSQDVRLPDIIEIPSGGCCLRISDPPLLVVSHDPEDIILLKQRFMRTK